MATDLAARWTSWIDLLESHGFLIRPVLQPGATDDEIAQLEVGTGLRLTDEIKALYRLNNGQRLRPTLGQVREGREAPWPAGAVPLFGFYEFLSTREAARSWQGWKDIDDDQGRDGMIEMAEPVSVPEPAKVKKEYWIPGWLPFSLDGGGNSFAFDFDPEPGGTVGQVIMIGSDEDTRHVLAPSIEALLGRLIEEWRQGRFEIESQDEGERYYDLPLLRGVTSS
jgi:cell wall assembly regulator SMI1